jgi:hypothetical protein
MEHRNGTDLARLRAWLSGEVRVSRALLLAGASALLLTTGLALD